MPIPNKSEIVNETIESKHLVKSDARSNGRWIQTNPDWYKRYKCKNCIHYDIDEGACYNTEDYEPEEIDEDSLACCAFAFNND